MRRGIETLPASATCIKWLHRPPSLAHCGRCHPIENTTIPNCPHTISTYTRTLRACRCNRRQPLPITCRTSTACGAPRQRPRRFTGTGPVIYGRFRVTGSLQRSNDGRLADPRRRTRSRGADDVPVRGPIWEKLVRRGGVALEMWGGTLGGMRDRTPCRRCRTFGVPVAGRRTAKPGLYPYPRLCGIPARQCRAHSTAVERSGEGGEMESGGGAAYHGGADGRHSAGGRRDGLSGGTAAGRHAEAGRQGSGGVQRAGHVESGPQRDAYAARPAHARRRPAVGRSVTGGTLPVPTPHSRRRPLSSALRPS